MQVALFTVAAGDPVALEELNRFLRGHRVLTMDRTWTGAGWSFCVTWQPALGAAPAPEAAKVDYRAVLDAPTFALFSRLREVRKALAEKENLPPYAVFTNEQLAAIARARCETPAALGKIDGIGAGRVEKYAPPILTAVAEHHAKLPGPA